MVPISPDTELSKTSPNVGEGGEQDTFYLLKVTCKYAMHIMHLMKN